MVGTMLQQFEEYDRRLFWCTIFIALCGLLAYAYFVGTSVVAVVARKEAEIKIGRMTATVAALESQYATLDQGVDLEKAHTLGFFDVPTARYVSRIPNQNPLSLLLGASE